MRRMVRALLVAFASAAACVSHATASGSAANGAPMDPNGLIADDIESEAYAAYRRLSAAKPFRGTEIVIIDYRLPSSARRLYIVNLMSGAVEPHYVAHGRGSDPDHTKRARRFSDAMSTGMSSVGAYRGLNPYDSAEHGPALRLAGLDPTNASAYRRLIVFHTAPYFDPAGGKLGRSCGCFVVTAGDMRRVYDVVANGGFLYAGPAALHDPAASTARDCSAACGSGCTAPPLVASVDPAPAPALAAVPPLAPAPTPAPAAPPTPPPVMVAAAPAPPPAPGFVAPTPRAKPDFAVTLVAGLDAPVPLPKPALDIPITSPVLAEADPVPTPLPKPVIETAPALALAAVTGAPVLGAKPLPAMPLAAAAIAVPDFAPGETPVPAPKPANLQRIADAGASP